MSDCLSTFANDLLSHRFFILVSATVLNGEPRTNFVVSTFYSDNKRMIWIMTVDVMDCFLIALFSDNNKLQYTTIQ